MCRLFWVFAGRTCLQVLFLMLCLTFIVQHYENTPIQIYWKFHHQKYWVFRKKSDIFHISTQNIDCGYSLELPHWGSSNGYPQSMFLSRNTKNNVYPCKPQFYYIKVGFKWVKNYIGMFSWWIEQVSLTTFVPGHLSWLNGKRCRPLPDARCCRIWSGSTLFAQAWQLLYHIRPNYCIYYKRPVKQFHSHVVGIHLSCIDKSRCNSNEYPQHMLL